jgi:hypothetical protein
LLTRFFVFFVILSVSLGSSALGYTGVLDYRVRLCHFKHQCRQCRQCRLWRLHDIRALYYNKHFKDHFEILWG